MNHYAQSIVGGLMGLATGLVLMRPVGAFFGPTTITWNASSCPAGIYTITSFVRGDDGVVGYSVTTSNVSLPRASVTQQFPNLPARVWQASAITTGEGRAFRSSTQALQGLGTDEGRLGRSRPAGTPVAGLARPRNSPPVTRPPEPRSTAPESAENLSIGQVLGRVLARLSAGLDPGAPDAAVLPWRLLVIEDLNGDGHADVATVESVDGLTLAIRIHFGGAVSRLP